MMKNQKWCKTCGNPPKRCECGAKEGYTTNIAEAYKTWMKRRKDVKEAKI